MIQLDFAASTAQEALSTRPTEVGYSQHDGAERARWGDSKLEIVGGTHPGVSPAAGPPATTPGGAPPPAVYPAAGSPANYYGQALSLGRSAAQGVGCDDTNGPSKTLHPEV